MECFAQAAVKGLIGIEILYFKLRFIDNYISKHVTFPALTKNFM